MKKWSWILTGIVLVVLILFFRYGSKGSVSIEEVKNRVNIKETKTWENYTAFIENTEDMDDILKVHDNINDSEIEIEEIKGDLYDIRWSSNGRYFTVNEGVGIAKTTHIVSMEDPGEVNSIVTIGDVIWSPDSAKLLIGVENSKKRDIEKELDGTIDLAAYYVESGTVETIIEADESVDYLPKDWDKNNNIKYIEAKGEKEKEGTMEYELSKEEMIMNIIKSDDKIKDLSQALSLLQHVDFNRLDRLYGEETVLNLLEWLSDKEIKGKEQVNVLLNLMDEFVGEENTTYIKSIAKSYLSDKITFIKALAEDPSKVDEVAYALHTLDIYKIKGEDLSKDIKMIIASDKLNKKEKEIGISLLNIYDSCVT